MDEVELSEDQWTEIKKQERLDRILAKWKPVLEAPLEPREETNRKTTLLGDDYMQTADGTDKIAFEQEYTVEPLYDASRNCPYIPENLPTANAEGQKPTWMSEYSKQMTNTMREAMNVPDHTNDVTYNPCTELVSPPIEEDVFYISDMNSTGVFQVGTDTTIQVGTDTTINTTSCGLTAEMKDLVREQCEAVIKGKHYLDDKPDCHRCYPDSEQSQRDCPPEHEPVAQEFDPEASFIGYCDVYTASDLIDKAKTAARAGLQGEAMQHMTHAQDLINKSRENQLNREVKAMKEDILNTVMSDQPKDLVQMENVSIAEDGTCYEKIEINPSLILIANERRRNKSNRNMTTGEVHSMVVAQVNCSQEEEDDYIVTDDYLKSIVPMHTFNRFLGETAAKEILAVPNSMETVIAHLDSRARVQPRTLLDVLDLWIALYGDTKPFEDNMERFMTEA